MPSIFHFLKRFKPGDSVRAFCSARHHNRVANVLEDIRGLNCRIIKPTNSDGRGWIVAIDGGSDMELPDGFPTLSDLAGGGALPDGTDYNQYLKWDHDAQEWVIVDSVLHTSEHAEET